MSSLFVPYSGERVAAIDIKGRRFVILSTERDTLEEGLHLLGADNMKELEDSDSCEQDRALNSLAEEVHGGLVIAPSDASLEEVLFSLEAQLAWLQ